jgi:hypothetical protein
VFGYAHQNKVKKKRKKVKAKKSPKKSPKKVKRKGRMRKAKSINNKMTIQDQDTPGFSANYTDLRVNTNVNPQILPEKEIEKENKSISHHQHTRSKIIKRDKSLDHLYTPSERLYRDHQNYLSKLDNIRDKEYKDHEEFQINKKSKYLCKHHIPIHKRLEVELENRKAKLQKLEKQVKAERVKKDKSKSDELYFPRTKLSYLVQERRSYINTTHATNEDFDVKPIDTSHQQFMNFLRDHQAWEYRKKKKIDDRLKIKEDKILQQLTFTPQINKKSLSLIPNKHERVETRLLRQAAQTEAKLENRRSAQELPFRPNIYSTGRHSR